MDAASLTPPPDLGEIPADCPCRKTDRYVSFSGIDCDGQAQRLMAMIDARLVISGHDSPFWPYFLAKRQPKSGKAPDDLFLIHCHLNGLRERFEAWEDEAALALLGQIEEECC